MTDPANPGLGSDPSPLAARKDMLRRHAKAGRDAIPEEERRQAAAALVRHAAAWPGPAPRVVSAYLPIRSEIDPLPLARALAGADGLLALPVVTGPSHALIFRRYGPEDTLIENGFGTRAPAPDAPELRPDLLLVPLLAFDRAGFRMGYGRGHYDRTLAGLRAAQGDRPVRAVGVAFAAQGVDAVPHDDYDQRLDAIVTEEGWIWP